MLMRRPVSWPYSSIGKSLMTILPSCMVISGVNVHLPEQNRRFNGLKRNLSAMPDQVISSDERPRSSLEMTWSGMADKFLFNPLNRLFCSGRCTFTPEMTMHEGKIVISDFPMLEYGHETGRLINILLKLVFQRAWLRRKLSESGNPVFLWQDEFQYFVTRRDNFFQQTCRGSRVDR